MHCNEHYLYQSTIPVIPRKIYFVLLFGDLDFFQFRYTAVLSLQDTSSLKQKEFKPFVLRGHMFSSDIQTPSRSGNIGPMHKIKPKCGIPIYLLHLSISN